MKPQWKHGIGLSVVVWIALIAHPFAETPTVETAVLLADVCVSLLFVVSLGGAVRDRYRGSTASDTSDTSASSSSSPSRASDTSSPVASESASADPGSSARLSQLDELREAGLVTEAEYEAKRRETLPPHEPAARSDSRSVDRLPAGESPFAETFKSLQQEPDDEPTASESRDGPPTGREATENR